MKSLKETVSGLMHNDMVRNDILKPLGTVVYNEVYFYLLLILVYCGVLFLAVLGSLFYLLSIHKNLSRLNANFLSQSTV
jgi:hypothetical protein